VTFYEIDSRAKLIDSSLEPLYENLWYFSGAEVQIFDQMLEVFEVCLRIFMGYIKLISLSLSTLTAGPALGPSGTFQKVRSILPSTFSNPKKAHVCTSAFFPRYIHDPDVSESISQ
jgi:hypothetical protein